MKIDTIAMHVRVPDVPMAKIWYERLFDRPPDFVADLDFLVEWEITAGAWLQLVKKSNHQPGWSRIRFGVMDLSAECDRAAEVLGIDISEVQFYKDLVAFCDFSDPFGNPLGFAQDLTRNPWRTADA